MKYHREDHSGMLPRTLAAFTVTVVGCSSASDQPPSFVFMMAVRAGVRRGLCAHSNGLAPLLDRTLQSAVLQDDMGWGDWSRTGAPAATPHLEAMSRAETAVWFHRAYSGNPICSPTRASVMTGRTPSRTCIYGVEQHILCRETPGIDGGCLHGEYSIANATRDHSAGYISGFYGKVRQVIDVCYGLFHASTFQSSLWLVQFEVQRGASS